ncbi:coat protein [ssRNA phage Gerhypos.4_1]|uniref:Coat protein n=2 Tax=Leviviricetes TaxID=2842243 RepID=A0A8S5L1B2_9VIRU|nr:coat protein [ssRNA phage Gerhypos.4_1]QDH91098.1 MAG: hypothetical protein H4Bulk461786_000002 [Leviviridae sp.]DAD51384.1 TPA_asm: coat protein [ssRNA phage Gerhypos.4_1]
MAFADPQSVTINAVAQTLPRTSVKDGSSVYTKDDGNTILTISHSYGKRNRRVARIDVRKTAPDPLFPAQNTPYNMACYVVVDVPKVGYTIVEQKQIVDALTSFLTATSGAATTRLLGGES